MLAYIARRILLMIPTLLGIMLISFVIVQFAPGGPVERMLAQLQGNDTSRHVAHPAARAATSRRLGRASRAAAPARRRRNIAARRGSTRPSSSSSKSSSASTSRAHERFAMMLWNYLRFDFGKSYFRDIAGAAAHQGEAAGLDLARALDDAASYAISIPLGIRKAVQDGSRFDIWTSACVIVGYAIPGFLFAILLIVLFAAARPSCSSSRCAA